jgi:hypothetical protein
MLTLDGEEACRDAGVAMFELFIRDGAADFVNQLLARRQEPCRAFTMSISA